MSEIPEQEFLQVLQDNGFMINDVIMNGTIQRVPVLTDRQGEVSGAYCGYLDGHPAGWFQNFKVHMKTEKWKYSRRRSDLSRAGEGGHRVRARKARDAAEARKLERDKAQARTYRHNAELCRKLYTLLGPPTNNGYLRLKQIDRFPGMKQDRKGNLVVPIIHADTFKIQSLLRIAPNGFKRLKKNARKQGGIFILGGKIKDGDPVILVEGVSTGASITMAINMPVIVCFDAGNLPTAAGLLRTRYPQSPFFIMGDEDRKSTINKGRMMAEAAADLVQGRAVFPVFTSETGLSDWNDLHVTEGLGTVRDQIQPHLEDCP